jgi:hypothetical protein
MAESTTTRSTSTRKKTTKRGPTKAAALKALGLTQEDLDTLKAVAAARAANDSDTEAEKLSEVVGHPVAGTSEGTSNVPEATTDIPNSLKSIEERKEEGKAQDTPLFIRNLMGTDFGFRLQRQKTGPRTDLKPRGQRGDIVRLEKEDYGDPNLERQIAYGCIEVITLAEARAAIEKQATNQRQAVHPAMAMLRNELGQEYAPDAIKVAPEFNSQGVTVAHLDPRQMRGELTDKEVARSGAMERVQPSGIPVQDRGLGHAQLGGNPAILNDGFARNDTAAAQDALARRRGLEGPAAAGITSVVVEAPQRS